MCKLVYYILPILELTLCISGGNKAVQAMESISPPATTPIGALPHGQALSSDETTSLQPSPVPPQHSRVPPTHAPVGPEATAALFATKREQLECLNNKYSTLTVVHFADSFPSFIISLLFLIWRHPLPHLMLLLFVIPKY